jgi:hypothetical protein
MDFPKRNVQLEHTLKLELSLVLIVKRALCAPMVVRGNVKVGLGRRPNRQVAHCAQSVTPAPPQRRQSALLVATHIKVPIPVQCVSPALNVRKEPGVHASRGHIRMQHLQHARNALLDTVALRPPVQRYAWRGMLRPRTPPHVHLAVPAHFPTATALLRVQSVQQVHIVWPSLQTQYYAIVESKLYSHEDIFGFSYTLLIIFYSPLLLNNHHDLRADFRPMDLKPQQIANNAPIQGTSVAVERESSARTIPSHPKTAAFASSVCLVMSATLKVV